MSNMLKSVLLCVIESLKDSLKKSSTRAEESRKTQGMLVNDVEKSKKIKRIVSKLKNANGQ